MRSKTCIIVLGTEDRKDMLMDFIASLDYMKEYDCLLLYQGSDKIEDPRVKEVYYEEKYKYGISHLRMMLLQKAYDLGYEYFIQADDDMIFTDKTEYKTAITLISQNSEIGAVSGNYARSEGNYKNLVKSVRGELKAYPVVNTFGGMVFSREKAKLLLDNPIYWSDNHYDIYSIYFYLLGYTNYFWYGSLCIHKSCRKLGVKESRKYFDYINPYTEYLFPISDKEVNSQRVMWNEDLSPKGVEKHLENVGKHDKTII